MSSRFPELAQARIVVSPVTRERHLFVIGAALSDRTRSNGHGRVLALALVLVLLVPVIALAAENSVPGDFLYPVKLVVEPIVQVFDYDAPAERRVRELEVLWERNATDEVIVQHVDIAREVVADFHPTLSDRIDRVALDLDARRADRQDLGNLQKPKEESLTRIIPVVPTDETDSEKALSTTSTTIEETTETTRPDDGRGDG